MDEFSEQYRHLVKDSYDCVDRIVLYGADEELDTNHLIRMAGRFQPSGACLR